MCKKSVFIPKTGGENAGDEKAGNSSILAELADDIQWQQAVGGVDDAGLRCVHDAIKNYLFQFIFLILIYFLSVYSMWDLRI